MMKDPHSDDILSAYFDGEATPQERAEVDRLQSSVPEVRRQLEDFERISRLLGDLPRESVPVEFSAEVMQQAERNMLLPDVPTPPAPRPGQFRLRLMVWGAAATAAGLLLMVFAFEARRSAPQRELAQLERSATHSLPAEPAPAAAPASAPASTTSTEDRVRLSRADQPVAGYGIEERLHEQAVRGGSKASTDLLRLGDSKKVVSPGQKEPLTDAEVAANSARRKASGAAADAAKDRQLAEAAPAVAAAAPQAKKSAQAEAKSGLHLVPARGANVNELKAGQIIDAIDMSGDRISVVKVTVVDVDQGLHAVQVVLEQNSIREQMPDTARGAGAAAPQQPVVRSGEMRGLLVDAPSEQISATVHELMKQNKLVVDIEMEQPIEVSQLGDAERELVSRSLTADHDQPEKLAPAPAGPGENKKENGKTLAGAALAAAKPAEDARKPADSAQKRDGSDKLSDLNSPRKERDTAAMKGQQLRRQAGLPHGEALAFSNAYQRMNVPTSVVQKLPEPERQTAGEKDAAAKKSLTAQSSQSQKVAQAQSFAKNRALAKGSVKLIFVIEPQAAKAKPAVPRKAGAAGGAA